MPSGQIHHCADSYLECQRAGYGNEGWLSEQFDVATDQRVGCGLITCSLAEKPHLLTLVLERNPLAMFLSFGGPAPFVAIAKEANVPVICQIQTLKDHSGRLILASAKDERLISRVPR